MEDLTHKVQQKLKDTHDVFYAMRYKNPSIKEKLKELDEMATMKSFCFLFFHNTHQLPMDHSLSTH